jgi:RsiW-degrading membrane proteinase PrsW (M82 family)
MSYPLYIFFGTLPSFIWLLFYLRADTHPESSKMILKIFVFGMLIAVPAILLETGLLDILQDFTLPTVLSIFLKVFVAVALVEEILKYSVVKSKVLDHPEFDEPIDVVLYMIIAALGFAAVENILILFSLGQVFFLEDVFLISVIRFWGATFLHALCSGVLGVFLALSIFETKKRKMLFAVGLGMVFLLHGLYNFSIMNTEGILSWLIPTSILVFLAIFLFREFRKLKQLKSVCKIYQ